MKTHYVGDDCPGGHITPDDVARYEWIERAAKRHLRENSDESWRELNEAIGPEKVRGRAD